MIYFKYYIFNLKCKIVCNEPLVKTTNFTTSRQFLLVVVVVVVAES